MTVGTCSRYGTKPTVSRAFAFNRLASCETKKWSAYKRVPGSLLPGNLRQMRTLSTLSPKSYSGPANTTQWSRASSCNERVTNSLNIELRPVGRRGFSHSKLSAIVTLSIAESQPFRSLGDCCSSTHWAGTTIKRITMAQNSRKKDHRHLLYDLVNANTQYGCGYRQEKGCGKQFDTVKKGVGLKCLNFSEAYHVALPETTV